MRRFPRDFYRPKGARIEYPDGLPEGWEIHRYENGSGKEDLPHAAVFSGERAKSDWHECFKTDEAREEKIAEWVESEKDNLREAKRKQAQADAMDGEIETYTDKRGNPVNAADKPY